MNKKIVIPAILLLGAAAGLLWYRHAAREAQNGVLYGNVDIREASLAFRVAGRVLEVRVDEGAARTIS